jgi:hypothetical protein
MLRRTTVVAGQNGIGGGYSLRPFVSPKLISRNDGT